MSKFEQRELFVPYIDLKTLPEHVLWPDTLPEHVKLVWQAALGFHETNTAGRLTAEVLARRAHMGVSTLYRTRRDYPKLLPYWPIKRHHRPPWLTDPSLLPASAVDYTPVRPAPSDRVAQKQYDLGGDLFEVAYDETTGVVVLMRRVVATLVAGYAIATSFDLSDGKLDGVVHWCHVAVAGGVLGMAVHL